MNESSTRVTHVGISVSDIDRSTDFYVDALGFTVQGENNVGDVIDKLVELEGTNLTARFLECRGTVIELLGWSSPPATGHRVRRPMNKVGLTHLCVQTDDFEGVVARIESGGGTVLRDTRVTLDRADGSQADLVYATDPDGTRIEIVEALA